MRTQDPPLKLQELALACDAVRTPVVTWGARNPLVGTVLRDKGARLATLCLGHALAALLLVLACPALLLVLGPLVLGVPHVASDLRYLVLRYEIRRPWRMCVLSFCVALFALRVTETGFLGSEWFARVEVLLVTLWIVLATTRVASPTRSVRTAALTAAFALAIGALGMLDAVRFRMIFAHAHNGVGIALWYFMFARRAGMSSLPLLAVAGVAGALLTVGGHAMIPYPEWLGLDVDAAKNWLAPNVADPYATGLVLCYTFLQSVHYAVWLVFIPQAAAKGRGTPTFARSLKSLWHDFGAVALASIALAFLVVGGFAFVDPLETQAVYLFVTPFHGYLELAMLAYWLSRSRGQGPDHDRVSIPLRP